MEEFEPLFECAFKSIESSEVEFLCARSGNDEHSTSLIAVKSPGSIDVARKLRRKVLLLGSSLNKGGTLPKITKHAFETHSIYSVSSKDFSARELFDLSLPTNEREGQLCFASTDDALFFAVSGSEGIPDRLKAAIQYSSQKHIESAGPNESTPVFHLSFRMREYLLLEDSCDPLDLDEVEPNEIQHAPKRENEIAKSPPSNQQIAEEIANKLRGKVKGDIDITVKDGVVILSGRVIRDRDKHRAGELAAKVSGITTVDNQLVSPTNHSAKSTKAIAGVKARGIHLAPASHAELPDRIVAEAGISKSGVTLSLDIDEGAISSLFRDVSGRAIQARHRLEQADADSPSHLLHSLEDESSPRPLPPLKTKPDSP